MGTEGRVWEQTMGHGDTGWYRMDHGDSGWNRMGHGDSGWDRMGRGFRGGVGHEQWHGDVLPIFPLSEYSIHIHVLMKNKS